jgi:PAS domain S-box-containing protein
MAVLRLEEPANPNSLRVVGVNPAAERIAAVPHSILGKRVDEDFPDIAITDLPRRIADVITNNTATDLGDLRGVYDRSRTFTIQAFPIPPDCCGILFEDVTARRDSERALRESELRFRKTFDASPAAICVFGLDSSSLVDANPRFVELLGYGSAGAMIGKPLEAFAMWTGDGEYRRLREDLRAARSLRETTVTYRTYGGQVRRALVALELIEIQGELCALGLFWRV